MDPTPKQKPERKPYQAPTLQHYGDLLRITRTVGANGLADGGPMGMNKTRV